LPPVGSLTRTISGGSLKGAAVVVVEDHDETRETLETVLTLAGARVRTAPSAQAGLLLVQKHRPDVLLADLQMPDIDGWELLRRLRALPPERGGQTPAVALTAHNSAADKERSLKAGFLLHLTKPFNPTELVDLLAALTVWARRDRDARPPKRK
jgi:CheY-like chemotaxis protein